MKSVDHVTQYLDRISGSVKILRFLALVIGVGMSAAGYFLRDSSTPWLKESSDTIWIIGLVLLLLANLVLVFVDKQAPETLKSLHRQELQLLELQNNEETLLEENDALNAWLALTKLLSELTDQAISAQTVDKENSARLYRATVEFIAEYKTRLFGFNDDYANIAIYEFNEDKQLLECVACYRTRASDAEGEHRSWKPGEGHVGKAFEVRTELVCSDARVPDVAAWIAAPPEKFLEEDNERYVSLAAIPIAIEEQSPLGVVIMTSSEPYRFVNSNELSSESSGTRAKYSVAALQDIAAQIAQLMYIMKLKRTNQEGETNDGKQ